MREWTLRMGLSLIITIGVWAGPSAAQPPLPPGVSMPVGPLPAIYLPGQTGLVIVPAVPYEPAYHPPYAPGFAAKEQPAPSPYPVHRMLNQHGMGCTANYWGACTNLTFNTRFVFGSCRDFFGDRCAPCQLHTSVPGLRSTTPGIRSAP